MSKKASYRLLSLDLDGTLLSPIFRRASKADCLTLQKYMSAGGMPFINTGRAPGAIMNTIERINKFGPNKIKFISCLNGAYIKDFTDGELIEHKICHEYSKQCLDVVKDSKIKNVYLWFHLPRSVSKYQIESYPYPWWANMYPLGKVVPVQNIGDLAAYKMDVISTSSNALNKIFREMKNRSLDKVLNITLSSKHLIEITPRDVSKGEAIDHFAKKYGVSRNCTCSMGDTFNDLAAFQHSGLSIAVKPKNKALTASVDCVVPKKKNGVSKAIYQHLLKDEVDNIEYKLLFTDLDGTLLDSSTKLYSVETKVALQQCTNHLIPIAIASGRGIYEIMNIANMMELNPKTNIYVIGNNGAAIYDIYTKQHILQQLIEEETAKKVFDDLVEYVKMFEGKAGFMIRQEGPQVYFYNKEFWKKVNLKKTGDADLYDPWIPTKSEYIETYPQNIKCYNMLFKFPDNATALKYSEELKKKYPDLTIALSSLINCEINAKDVNKANAAKQLSQLIQIPLNKFMALGDGQNDIPTFKICEHSYVPCYAPDFVKKEAKIIIPDVTVNTFASTVIYKNLLKKTPEEKILKINIGKRDE